MIHNRKFVSSGVVLNSTLGERQVRIGASDSSVDRDGDVLLAEGAELAGFSRNPIFLCDRRVDAPIGTVNLGLKNGCLEGVVTFAPKGISEIADTPVRAYEGRDCARSLSWLLADRLDAPRRRRPDLLDREMRLDRHAHIDMDQPILAEPVGAPIFAECCGLPPRVPGAARPPASLSRLSRRLSQSRRPVPSGSMSKGTASPNPTLGVAWT